ncbi:unnamed protein product [Lathyrus oleraceus]
MTHETPSQKGSGYGGEVSYSSKSGFNPASSKNQWRPNCWCGDFALLGKAKTVKKFGNQFWGCPHYKGNTNNGRDYFAWFYAEVKHDRDMFIKNQKKRLEILAKENEDQHQKLLKFEGLIEELEGGSQ